MSVIDDVDRTRFGPYRLIRRIGTGGMGSIFEAEDTGLGHRVALKLLHPHVAERPGAARRFLREGRAAARIRHPHIVQVHALGTEGNTPYLAMELLDRGNMSDLIAGRGRLPERDALDLVLPVIAAVAAAHDAGVIHRDLKPSNVCLAQGAGAKPWPKVVDFGVSKVVATGGNHEATATETVIGTAAYMAPEQARAASNASFLSDQYSLAVLLYECVTGSLPFAGRSMYEVLESVMSAPLVAPSTRADGVSSALDQAVLRAMSRDPHDRFPSVRAFGTALLPLASEQARATFGAELREDATSHSNETVAYDLVPLPLVANVPTPFGDSATPFTEPSYSPGADRRFRVSGSLAALLGSALVVTSLALWPRRQGAPVLNPVPPIHTSTALPSVFNPPVEVSMSNRVQHEILPAASSPPSSDVLVPPPRTSPSSVGRADRPRHSSAAIRIGDNGAPILP